MRVVSMVMKASLSLKYLDIVTVRICERWDCSSLSPRTFRRYSSKPETLMSAILRSTLRLIPLLLKGRHRKPRRGATSFRNSSNSILLSRVGHPALRGADQCDRLGGLLTHPHRTLWVFSKSSNCFFTLIPCPNPPRPPLLSVTRWQGRISGKGFEPLAFPTARKAFGWPMALAIS